jgi:hypothetical protein
MLKTLAQYFAKLDRLARTDRRELPQEAWLASRHSRPRAVRQAGPDTPLVAVGAAPDFLYCAIFGEIISALRAHSEVRIEQLATLGFRPGAAQSLRGFVRAQLQYNRLWQRKWERLYGAFCDRVGYRALSRHPPLAEAGYWLRALRLWRGLQSKEQLVTLSHQGILIGDLIADTYLRLRPSPFIDLKDPYLAVVIRQALKDISTAFTYFNRRRPRIYLTSYTTYVQHGVPARVAVSLGIHTVAFGNHQQLATEITPGHLFQTKRADKYSHDFDTLPGQAEKLAQAEAALRTRLSGLRDEATAYMRASAYEVKTSEVPDLNGAAVIFLHDFYDSAHIYRWMVFHDFWEWVSATIEGLDAAGIPYYLKPHPNQAAQSNLEIARLCARYPHIRLLSPEITNAQLVAAGMRCAITVYGTVATEMAFMGVPSISSSDSPHASFDAFGLARSKDEYRQLLSGIAQLRPDTARLKMQACACYVMHNGNLDAEALDARNKYVAAWAHLIRLGKGSPFVAAETEAVLSALSSSPGFKRHIQDLTAQLGRPSPNPNSLEDLQCSQMLQS